MRRPVALVLLALAAPAVALAQSAPPPAPAVAPPATVSCEVQLQRAIKLYEQTKGTRELTELRLADMSLEVERLQRDLVEARGRAAAVPPAPPPPPR